MKEIKEELNKWKDTPCSLSGRLTIIKMSALPKLIYKFHAISIKIPVSYFMGINKMIIKFIWKSKRPRTANTILKESKVRWPTLPNLKTYYKGTVIRTVWYWWKNRQIDQWDKIQSPEIDPNIDNIVNGLWHSSKSNTVENSLFNKWC